VKLAGYFINRAKAQSRKVFFKL